MAEERAAPRSRVREARNCLDDFLNAPLMDWTVTIAFRVCVSN